MDDQIHDVEREKKREGIKRNNLTKRLYKEKVK
jgi:hypothetical protein